MKEQAFPIFYRDPATKSRDIDPEPFLNHLANLADPTHLHTHMKPIQQNILMLTKQQHNHQHILHLVKLLCHMFKQTPSVDILTLLKASISADVKYEAFSRPNDDVLNTSENVRAAVSDQPIALPYEPEGQVCYGPELPYAGPVIALHNQEAMSDVTDQRKQGDAKSYFASDNEMVSNYMESPFKVVKREGISELFTSAAEIISTELMQDYLETNFLRLHLTVVEQLVKLLQYISAPIYSFHLLKIAQVITNAIYRLLETKEAEKALTKSIFSGLTSSFNNIAERWSEYPAFSLDQWNWEVESRMISLFIKSQVSQKKLYAVKTLGQICRKSTHYNYTISPEKIKVFVAGKGILDEIFRADNHPQVIAKGEEVFIYMTKNQSLNNYLINLIFNLLEKCHENLSKSLFAMLQKVEEKNIENHRAYLLQKIEELPRPNCFNEETFSLIKRIIIVTPPQEVHQSLLTVCKIIDKNYQKLRENLKTELITLYYQVYLMGIELGVFDQSNALSPLKPLLSRPQSNLYLRMIESFISKLKDKSYHHSYGAKCKKTLHEGIKQLIREERIHELKHEDRNTHLNILLLLLQSYESANSELLTPEELWNLIRIDSRFTKFIRYYPEAIQINMVSELIKRSNKSAHDIQCIVDLYNFMTPTVRKTIEPLISSQYYYTQDMITKYTLAPEILKIHAITFNQALQNISQSTKEPWKLVSWLILMREILCREDEKGYGDYPPFDCLANEYDVRIEVVNSNSMDEDLKLTFKSYYTMYEVLCKILQVLGRDRQALVNTRVKLFNRYLEFQDLKKKLSSISGYRSFQLQVYQTDELAWFDKTQLFDRDNMFKADVIDCLKQIFLKFARDSPRLNAQGIAEIFAIAAKLDNVSPYDSKVTSIINQYSNNGESLTFEEWVQFYYQAALNNPTLVLQNLINLGYIELFSSVCNFELFRRTEEVRKEIAKTDTVYKVLFDVYNEAWSTWSEQGLRTQLTEEITKTLSLLPTYQRLLEAIRQHKEGILNEENDNPIATWYASKALKAIYFQQLKVEDYEKWKTLFLESNTFRLVKCTYIRYLQTVLAQSLENFNLKSNISLTIMENLGKIARQCLTKIPNLANVNYDETSPLTVADVDFFLDINLSNFSAVVNKITAFCLVTCNANANICISENLLAVVAHFVLKDSRQKRIEGLKVDQDLVFHEKDAIRFIFNAFYYLLSNVVPSIKEGYYAINVTNKSAHAKSCKQYFNVLSKILSFQEDESCYSRISKSFQRDISQYDSSREMQHFEETDQVLLGQLKVINYIKLYSPQTVIESTTLNSIQNLLQTNSSEAVREILYSMSNQIGDYEASFKVMAKIMDNLQLSRNSKIRGKDKMGMLNLGCICYINSVVQQLEMIEPFRVGIIATQVPSQSYDFFREFQRMLYQLTFGQRIYLVPQQFCLNYLDSSGNPVNTKQQHDADQFLNQLFDRLENRLRHTNEQSLISNSFKGEVVNVINCDKCFHKKQRIETFYILSVEIKNLKTIEQCINKYAEPQIICDYFCEFCDTKVQSIQKYHRFRSLPPFLFIHMQRLVFDLEFMYKIKLDHPIEFPQELNLTDFFNSRCEEPAIYSLKGFVVHVGSSQGGHYYSLIKCDGQWIKFDDTRIDFWSWQNGTHDKNHAYMLIYEKKSLSEQLCKRQVKIGNKELLQQIRKDNFSLLKEKIFLQPSFTKFLIQTISQVPIPSQFTFEFSELMNPYHPKFSELSEKMASQLDFIFDVILQYLKLQSQNRQLNLQGIYQDMQEIPQHQHKQSTELQRIALYIIYILHLRPHLALGLAKQYTSDAQNNLFSTIFNHRQKQFRQIFKTILFKIFSIIRSDIYTNFMLPIPPNELIQKLLQRIVVSLCEVGKNPNKMLEFFELINMLLKSDNRFGEWFKFNKLGPRLIHMLMQNESQLADVFPNYPFYLNTSSKQPSIHYIIEILIDLVQFEKDISVESEEVKLERKAYLNFEFYRKILLDRYENARIPTLLNFCSTNNPEFTQKLLSSTIESLNRFNHTDRYIYTYLNILYNSLMLEDNLQRQRIERLLGVPLIFKKYEKEGEEYSIKKETDRLCRYQNPSEKKGDEIILCFLELLYINRKELNYFVIMGIGALMNLMANSPTILAYLQKLPGPCPAYPNYTDWIIEFIYDSQRLKQDSPSQIPFEQKSKALQEIASLINKFQNKESESGHNAQSRLHHRNINNKPYFIKEITGSTEWTEISLNFNGNLFLKDSTPEELQEINQSQLIKAQYRTLFGPNEQGEEATLILQYRLNLNCKAKLRFRQGYEYTLNFEKETFEFAIPFFQDQTSFLSFEVNAVELTRVLNHLKGTQNKMMEIEQKHQKKTIQQEFPTIAQAYPQMNDAFIAQDTKIKEEVSSGNTFQCPFCNHTTAQFTSRCPGCGQDWGDMA